MTGYRVANRMMARFEALGTTSESRLPSRNVIGTSTYADLICPSGLDNTLTVTSLAPILDM